MSDYGAEPLTLAFSGLVRFYKPVDTEGDERIEEEAHVSGRMKIDGEGNVTGTVQQDRPAAEGSISGRCRGGGPQEDPFFVIQFDQLPHFRNASLAGKLKEGELRLTGWDSLARKIIYAADARDADTLPSSSRRPSEHAGPEDTFGANAASEPDSYMQIYRVLAAAGVDPQSLDSVSRSLVNSGATGAAGIASLSTKDLRDCGVPVKDAGRVLAYAEEAASKAVAQRRSSESESARSSRTPPLPRKSLDTSEQHALAEDTARRLARHAGRRFIEGFRIRLVSLLLAKSYRKLSVNRYWRMARRAAMKASQKLVESQQQIVVQLGPDRTAGSLPHEVAGETNHKPDDAASHDGDTEKDDNIAALQMRLTQLEYQRNSMLDRLVADENEASSRVHSVSEAEAAVAKQYEAIQAKERDVRRSEKRSGVHVSRLQSLQNENNALRAHVESLQNKVLENTRQREQDRKKEKELDVHRNERLKRLLRDGRGSTSEFDRQRVFTPRRSATEQRPRSLSPRAPALSTATSEKYKHVRSSGYGTDRGLPETDSSFVPRVFPRSENEMESEQHLHTLYQSCLPSCTQRPDSPRSSPRRSRSRPSSANRHRTPSRDRVPRSSLYPSELSSPRQPTQAQAHDHSISQPCQVQCGKRPESRSPVRSRSNSHSTQSDTHQMLLGIQKKKRLGSRGVPSTAAIKLAFGRITRTYGSVEDALLSISIPQDSESADPEHVVTGASLNTFFASMGILHLLPPILDRCSVSAITRVHDTRAAVYPLQAVVDLIKTGSHKSR
ncbi:hypothetical protein DIPPA_61698 [Diplonema papillatum]|nr:hypothetical protein DIPPA_61698 [Diplonema papillatum]